MSSFSKRINKYLILENWKVIQIWIFFYKILSRDELFRLLSFKYSYFAFMISSLFPMQRASVIPEVDVVSSQWNGYASFQEKKRWLPKQWQFFLGFGILSQKFCDSLEVCENNWPVRAHLLLHAYTKESQPVPLKETVLRIKTQEVETRGRFIPKAHSGIKAVAEKNPQANPCDCLFLMGSVKINSKLSLWKEKETFRERFTLQVNKERTE